jgi:hypothetical protein
MERKDEFDMFAEIAERADKMGLLMSDRLTLAMDLDYTNRCFNLELNELLNADNSNFAHDICGIQNNFNRKTLKMENCFTPRFSNSQRIKLAK